MNLTPWIATADRLPAIPSGNALYFWITCRRKNGELCALPASYANALRLWSDEPTSGSGSGWSRAIVDCDENDDGNIAITGWYQTETDNQGEYDHVYAPVCGIGDKVIAWQERPAPFDPGGPDQPSTPAGPSPTEKLITKLDALDRLDPMVDNLRKPGMSFRKEGSYVRWSDVQNAAGEYRSAQDRQGPGRAPEAQKPLHANRTHKQP